MSSYATTKYLSLFDTLNSDHVVNKLQKSFYEIKTSTTESKTEAEVLKWAQDTINSKTDEEVKQMVFLNAAKGAFILFILLQVHQVKKMINQFYMMFRILLMIE